MNEANLFAIGFALTLIVVCVADIAMTCAAAVK